MRDVVLAQWVAFSTEFESDVPWLYLDVEGYVTIGLGLLADPFEDLVAMAIDFVWPGTCAPASRADVAAAWHRVKNATPLERGGGGAFEKLPGNEIRATPDSLARAAQQKLAASESILRGFFPGWDTFPGAGQMLILSMRWAMGAKAFAEWPHFCAAVNAGDWLAVATPHGVPASCQMSEARENASFHLRNLTNLELARHAAFAVDHELPDDLDVASIIADAKAARAAGA